MNDRMKDLVCPMCGSDDLEPSFDGDSMRCDRCEKWMPLDETETRAEYLAGNDDDPRDDPATLSGADVAACLDDMDDDPREGER